MIIEGIYEGKELLYEMERKRNYAWSTWINFVKREFLASNNLKFYNGIIYEDVLFSYEVFVYAKRSMYVTECKYVYRKRPLSTTTEDKSLKHLYGYLVGMNDVLGKGLKAEQTEKFKYATISYFLRMYREGYGLFNQITTEICTDGWPKEIKVLFELLYENYRSGQSYIDYNQIYEHIEEIKKSEKTIVYGAGKAAEQLMRMLQENDIAIDGVAVTDLNNSKKTLFGHKVYNIDDFLEVKAEAVVLIAITPKYVDKVLQDLKDKGFKKVLYVCKSLLE